MLHHKPEMGGIIFVAMETCVRSRPQRHYFAVEQCIDCQNNLLAIAFGLVRT